MDNRKVGLWVKLYDVPLEIWHHDFFVSVGNRLGSIVKVDETSRGGGLLFKLSALELMCYMSNVEKFKIGENSLEDDRIEDVGLYCMGSVENFKSGENSIENVMAQEMGLVGLKVYNGPYENMEMRLSNDCQLSTGFNQNLALVEYCEDVIGGLKNMEAVSVVKKHKKRRMRNILG
ncbi:hypothetical protein DITRI_Ditri17bG0094300 [Diplodiscus trichospermus]